MEGKWELFAKNWVLGLHLQGTGMAGRGKGETPDKGRSKRVGHCPWAGYAFACIGVEGGLDSWPYSVILRNLGSVL